MELNDERKFWLIQIPLTMILTLSGVAIFGTFMNWKYSEYAIFGAMTITLIAFAILVIRIKVKERNKRKDKGKRKKKYFG